MPKYVGRRIVPKHGGIWDKTKEYEELIIVLCQETGVSYISKLPVPAGTEIFNEHYWAVCSEFSEQIKLAEDHLTQTAEDVSYGTDRDRKPHQQECVRNGRKGHPETHGYGAERE